ncbi:MAG: hypothetical protein ACKVPX_14970 [Myxococcaceae bacterium]
MRRKLNRFVRWGQSRATDRALHLVQTKFARARFLGQPIAQAELVDLKFA